jgi:hypothetical protein
MVESSAEEVEPWLGDYNRIRCEYLAHLGPYYLAKTLAKRPQKGRHDALEFIKDRFKKPLVWQFAPERHYPAGVHPADIYSYPDILPHFSQMPESQQPSPAWEMILSQI